MWSCEVMTVVIEAISVYVTIKSCWAIGSCLRKRTMENCIGIPLVIVFLKMHMDGITMLAVIHQSISQFKFSRFIK